MELIICVFIIIVIIFLLRKELMTNNDLYSKDELIELGLFDLQKKNKVLFKTYKKKPDVVQRLAGAKKIILK